MENVKNSLIKSLVNFVYGGKEYKRYANNVQDHIISEYLAELPVSFEPRLVKEDFTSRFLTDSKFTVQNGFCRTIKNILSNNSNLKMRYDAITEEYEEITNAKNANIDKDDEIKDKKLAKLCESLNSSAGTSSFISAINSDTFVQCLKFYSCVDDNFIQEYANKKEFKINNEDLIKLNTPIRLICAYTHAKILLNNKLMKAKNKGEDITDITQEIESLTSEKTNSVLMAIIKEEFSSLKYINTKTSDIQNKVFATLKVFLRSQNLLESYYSGTRIYKELFSNSSSKNNIPNIEDLRILSFNGYTQHIFTSDVIEKANIVDTDNIFNLISAIQVSNSNKNYGSIDETSASYMYRALKLIDKKVQQNSIVNDSTESSTYATYLTFALIQAYAGKEDYSNQIGAIISDPLIQAYHLINDSDLDNYASVAIDIAKDIAKESGKLDPNFESYLDGLKTSLENKNADRQNIAAPTGSTDSEITPVDPTGSTEPEITPVGPTGPEITPTGPTGPTGPEITPVDPTGSTDPEITPVGPTGLEITPVGPTGPENTPTGPTGPTGSTGPKITPVRPSGSVTKKKKDVTVARNEGVKTLQRLVQVALDDTEVSIRTYGEMQKQLEKLERENTKLAHLANLAEQKKELERSQGTLEGQLTQQKNLILETFFNKQFIQDAHIRINKLVASKKRRLTQAELGFKEDLNKLQDVNRQIREVRAELKKYKNSEALNKASGKRKVDIAKESLKSSTAINKEITLQLKENTENIAQNSISIMNEKSELLKLQEKLKPVLNKVSLEIDKLQKVIEAVKTANPTLKLASKADCQNQKDSLEIYLSFIQDIISKTTDQTKLNKLSKEVDKTSSQLAIYTKQLERFEKLEKLEQNVEVKIDRTEQEIQSADEANPILLQLKSMADSQEQKDDILETYRGFIQDQKDSLETYRGYIQEQISKTTDQDKVAKLNKQTETIDSQLALYTEQLKRFEKLEEYRQEKADIEKPIRDEIEQKELQIAKLKEEQTRLDQENANLTQQKVNTSYIVQDNEEKLQQAQEYAATSTPAKEHIKGNFTDEMYFELQDKLSELQEEKNRLVENIKKYFEDMQILELLKEAKVGTFDTFFGMMEEYDDVSKKLNETNKTLTQESANKEQPDQVVEKQAEVVTKIKSEIIDKLDDMLAQKHGLWLVETDIKNSENLIAKYSVQLKEEKEILSKLQAEYEKAVKAFTDKYNFALHNEDTANEAYSTDDWKKIEELLKSQKAKINKLEGKFNKARETKTALENRRKEILKTIKAEKAMLTQKIIAVDLDSIKNENQRATIDLNENKLAYLTMLHELAKLAAALSKKESTISEDLIYKYTLDSDKYSDEFTRLDVYNALLEIAKANYSKEVLDEIKGETKKSVVNGMLEILKNPEKYVISDDLQAIVNSESLQKLVPITQAVKKAEIRKQKEEEKAKRKTKKEKTAKKPKVKKAEEKGSDDGRSI